MPTPRLPVEELERRFRAFREHGNYAAGARALGVDRQSFRIAVDRYIADNPGKLGLAPPGPTLGTSPHYIKGVSSLVDAAGNTRLQWIKTASRPEAIAAAIEARIEARIEELPPIPKVPAPTVKRVRSDDLATMITLTDLHVGMYASEAESGDGGWDRAKAKNAALKAVRAAVAVSPPAGTVILTLLGDILHYDPPFQHTPTSKHPVTSDGRPSEMVDTTLEIVETLVAFLLTQYAKVVVIVEEGNHDIGSTIWLARYIRLLLRSNPRGEVVHTPTPFTEYVWGDNLLVFHHSHKANKNKLMKAVPALFRQRWGQSRFCYVHSGHYHHVESKEDGGMEWQQHPTVAGRDDYASDLGLIAVRRLLAITYHKRYGEWQRNSVTVEMAEDLCA